MTPDFRTLERSDDQLTPPGMTFVTVRSTHLDRRADVLLYASDDSEAKQDVPIIVLLHGVFGSHWAWAFKGAAHLTAQRLVDQGVIGDCVLCMPSDGLWGDGSGYLKHEHADYERWIVEEAVGIPMQLLPQCSETSAVYIAGLSMGGFGALRLAARNPDVFAAAYGHSSVTSASDLRLFTVDYEQQVSQQSDEDSLIESVVASGESMPPFGFDCGLEDELLPANRELHRQLEAAGVPHEYHELSGQHDWAYWRSRLEVSLSFFGRHAQTQIRTVES